MSTAGVHLLHHAGSSPVHRLAPQVKIVCAFLAVLCVVSTPREWFLVFAFDLAVVLVIWAVAGVRIGWFARRAVIEVPFIVFAVLLPFVGAGERTPVLGVAISIEGTMAGWNILAKGTLGVLIALTLAATTHPKDILLGMQRLRVPTALTVIAAMMLRYVDVVIAETRRMRMARIARGDDPRWMHQIGATAATIGSLFLRSYERGERVHRAMISRGWTGQLPVSSTAPVGLSRWIAGTSPALILALGLGVAGWAA